MRWIALAAVALIAPQAALAAVPRTAPIEVAGIRGFERSEPGALLTGIVLSIDAGLDRETAREDGLAALVAESLLRSPVPGAPGNAPSALADAVDARGAAIDYAILPGQVRFYLEGTTEGVARAVPLLAEALQRAAFDGPTLAAARAALGDRIKDDESDPRFVGRAMLRASYYRGSAGLAPFGNAATLAQLGPADAKGFFERWYRRGGAVVAAVGRTGEASETAIRTLSAALPPGAASAAPAIAAKPFAAQPKRIVTQRDVGAPYVALGFAAPAFGDRDFPAALVIRSLLDGAFDRASSMTLPPAFRSVGAIYDYDTVPAHVVLWINGAQIDPDVGLAAIDAVVRGAAAKPLSAATLGRYKERARGTWILETLSLEQRAAAIDRAVSRGLDPDAADEIAAAIARVGAADVQRVAKKYFQRFDVALILPRTNGR